MKIIALDLETSGLNSQYDQINQIGLALMEDGQVLDAYTNKVRASEKYKISLDALAVQIGTPPMEEDGPEAAEAWLSKANEFMRERLFGPSARDVAAEVKAWCERVDAHLYPTVAHNAAFDYGFWATWLFNQRAVFKAAPTSETWVCTMTMAKRVMPGQKSYSLDTCLLAADIAPRPKAHDALADAIKAGELYHWLQNQGVKP